MHPGVIYALLAAALFGASTPLAQSLLGQVEPVMLAGLLYLGSALGLALLALLRCVVPRLRSAGSAGLVRQDLPWLAAALMDAGLWLHLSKGHQHEHAHQEMTHAPVHRHDEHHQHQHQHQHQAPARLGWDRAAQSCAPAPAHAASPSALSGHPPPPPALTPARAAYLAGVASGLPLSSTYTPSSFMVLLPTLWASWMVPAGMTKASPALTRRGSWPSIINSPSPSST